MIKKLLALLFLLSIGLPVQAQYDYTPGTIYLQNGKTHEGLVNLPMHSAGLEFWNSKVKFKKNKDAKKKKFKEKKIDKVVFVNEKGEKAVFRAPSGMEELYQVLIDGETKLYGRMVVSGGSMTMQGASVSVGGAPVAHTMFIPNFSTYNELLVYRPGDDAPVNLIPTGFGSFRKKAMEYFADCPSLVKKIDDKTYKRKDLEQIVRVYNDCK